MEGVLPLDRNRYVNIVRDVLGKGTDVECLYTENISWDGFKTAIATDTGPCAALIYESLQGYDYHNTSEAFTDSMNGVSPDVIKRVVERYKSRTIPKTVLFYSDWVQYPDGTLKSLILYVLRTVFMREVKSYDCGYDGGGEEAGQRGIKEENIVGLLLEDPISKRRREK